MDQNSGIKIVLNKEAVQFNLEALRREIYEISSSVEEDTTQMNMKYVAVRTKLCKDVEFIKATSGVVDSEDVKALYNLYSSLAIIFKLEESALGMKIAADTALGYIDDYLAEIK